MGSVSGSFSLHTTAQILLALSSLIVGFKLGFKKGSTSRSKSAPLPPILNIPPPESEIQKAVAQDAQDAGLLNEQEQEQDEEKDRNAVEEREELEEVTDGDLAAIVPKVWEPCKLVLVVRTDLKMSPGDIAAQCSDATLACYKALLHKNAHLVRHWEITGQAKIALKGTSEEQLLELEAIAKSLNLCARAVHNEELTKDKEGTRTVLGVGPAPVDLVNKVTGKLRLL